MQEAQSCKLKYGSCKTKPIYSYFYSLQIANGNQISEIPVENLGSLPMLAVLDLSNNDIQHVPPLLGRVTQIRTLQLEGNPFRVPRPQILVQGTQSIMQYLRNRIPADGSKEPA